MRRGWLTRDHRVARKISDPGGWNRPHLSARFSPFYGAGGCAGSWRLPEDFPGNLCLDRAQSRRARPRHTSRRRFTTSPAHLCGLSNARINTRTLFQPGKTPQLFALYRSEPRDSRSTHEFLDLSSSKKGWRVGGAKRVDARGREMTQYRGIRWYFYTAFHSNFYRRIFFVEVRRSIGWSLV